MGERLTTEAAKQAEIEHLHRYFLARHLCRGLNVLDLDQSQRYGSALLAQTARSDVGIDVHRTFSVAHARAAYIASDLRFLEGMLAVSQCRTHSVDVVVSFETIEHLYFLGEVRRVLQPERGRAMTFQKVHSNVAQEAAPEVSSGRSEMELAQVRPLTQTFHMREALTIKAKVTANKRVEAVYGVTPFKDREHGT